MYSKSKLLEKALAQLGFELLEIEVYQSLLETRKLNIKNLALKFGTNRVKIYQILDKLQLQGLLNYSKGTARELNLESPSKILGLLKFQEAETSRLSKDFSDFLPDLLTNFFNSSSKPIFKVYEGKAQFMGIFNQILEELKPEQELVVLGEGEDFIDIIYLDYFREWMKKRIIKKLRVRILGRPENSFLKELAPNNEKELRQLKFLPVSFKLTEGNLFIMENKVIIWNTIQVQAVVIENKAIASFFKGIFEGIWRSI